MSPTLRRLRLWLQASALLAGGLLGAAVPALGQIVDKFIEDVPTYQNVPHNLPREPLNVHEDVRGELSPDPPRRSHSFVGRDDQQDPSPPFVYLVGREIGRDLASPTRSFVGDGIPDTWLRMNARNLGFYIGRGGGFYITAMILQAKGQPFRRWDTLPNSSYPLLQVIHNGRRINRADGNIAGFNPPRHEVVDLYIGDDGSLAARHTPMELTVVTLDGAYRMEVGLFNMWDNKID